MNLSPSVKHRMCGFLKTQPKELSEFYLSDIKDKEKTGIVKDMILKSIEKYNLNLILNKIIEHR